MFDMAGVYLAPIGRMRQKPAEGGSYVVGTVSPKTPTKQHQVMVVVPRTRPSVDISHKDSDDEMNDSGDVGTDVTEGNAEAKTEEVEVGEGSVATPVSAGPAEFLSPSNPQACGCDQGIPDEWLGNLEQDEEIGFQKALKQLTEARSIPLMCDLRWQLLAARLGMKSLRGESLITALDQIYERRERPWQLKTNVETYHYFRASKRSPQPLSRKGAFQFAAD